MQNIYKYLDPKQDILNNAREKQIKKESRKFFWNKWNYHNLWDTGIEGNI